MAGEVLMGISVSAFIACIVLGRALGDSLQLKVNGMGRPLAILGVGAVSGGILFGVCHARLKALDKKVISQPGTGRNT